MTTPDDATPAAPGPHSLVEPEGVDAGSAASSSEGDAGPDPAPPAPVDLLGPAATAADADDGVTHAHPDEVPAPQAPPGPGQQLQAGEG